MNISQMMDHFIASNRNQLIEAAESLKAGDRDSFAHKVSRLAETDQVSTLSATYTSSPVAKASLLENVGPLSILLGAIILILAFEEAAAIIVIIAVFFLLIDLFGWAGVALILSSAIDAMKK